MQLLITGGNGRLARALMGTLLAEGAVRAVDATFSAPLPEGVEGREGDLRDPVFVEAALEGVDTVLHLAPIDSSGPDGLEVLDRATRGTYVLVTSARRAGVKRLLLGSTLDLFARLPAHWRVSENWRPRPQPEVESLAPWLAELSVRECMRGAQLSALCLRFGRLVDDAEAAARPYDPRWLHIDDAVLGVRQALHFWRVREEASGWHIFHITAAGEHSKIRLSHAGRQTLGYEPNRDLSEFAGTQDTPALSDSRDWRQALVPTHRTPSRPIRRVVIFGAGGPVAAAVAADLAGSYTLRLTDVRPIAQIAEEGVRQGPGAPLPVPLETPHESRVVDVRNPEEVYVACAGMDAIINCSVVRREPIEAFRVNTLGAYNVAQAAARHGIRRVVHTGPQMVDVPEVEGYSWDFEVPGDSLPRPGSDLYFHSKYLGQEICRVFAEEYDLEIPVLLYCQFLDPKTGGGLHSFSISWEDSARAIRRALEVRSLPSCYEVMNIVADLPHGKFSNQRAKALLGWEPRDNMESFWQTPSETA